MKKLYFAIAFAWLTAIAEGMKLDEQPIYTQSQVAEMKLKIEEKYDKRKEFQERKIKALESQLLEERKRRQEAELVELLLRIRISQNITNEFFIQDKSTDILKLKTLTEKHQKLLQSCSTFSLFKEILQRKDLNLSATIIDYTNIENYVKAITINIQKPSYEPMPELYSDTNSSQRPKSGDVLYSKASAESESSMDSQKYEELIKIFPELAEIPIYRKDDLLKVVYFGERKRPNSSSKFGIQNRNTNSKNVHLSSGIEAKKEFVLKASEKIVEKNKLLKKIYQEKLRKYNQKISKAKRVIFSAKSFDQLVKQHNSFLHKINLEMSEE